MKCWFTYVCTKISEVLNFRFPPCSITISHFY